MTRTGKIHKSPPLGTTFSVRTAYIQTLITRVSETLGEVLTRQALRQHIHAEELDLNDLTAPRIRTEDPRVARRALTALIDLLAESFGSDYTERLLLDIFTKQLDGDLEYTHYRPLLDVIPDGYLEKEKIRDFTRSELEERVLQRTRELREINAVLEERIAARTAELTEANATLAANNVRLKELSRAKTEFVSLAAHQLQDPLTAITWTTESLEHALSPSCLTKNIHEYIAAITAQSFDMNSLIKELLQLAHLEEQRMRYTKASFDLGKLLEEVTTALRSTAQHRNVTVRTTTFSDVFLVHADKEKIRWVISNLISNAIKYSEEHSRVNVQAVIRDRMVVMSITDHGIGIPPEEQKKIFTKFFRAENARAQRTGTGLGLYLARRIVRDHGGDITFTSVVKQGTTFTLRLPLTEEPANAKDAAQH